jgi:enamine deaminase RidA (YjgF/YER057c/UK114 family)
LTAALSGDTVYRNLVSFGWEGKGVASTLTKIVRLQPESVPRPQLGHPQAVVFDDLIFLSGQMATDYSTGVVPAEGRSNVDFPYWQIRMDFQAARIIETIKEILAAAGANADDAAKVVSFHTDLRELPSSMATRTKYFKPEGPPASTALGISALPVVDAGFQFEMIGFRPGGKKLRRAIHTEAAPVASLREMYRRPIFSQAVRVGDLIFTQGSIATDFKSNIAAEAAVDPAFRYYSSEIKNQTAYLLRTLGRVLEAGGSSLQHVVKADVYLPDIDDYPGMDEAFREAFPSDPPARSVVPVRELVVRGARTEISLVALAADGQTQKEVVQTSDAPRPLGWESQAVKAGNLVFLSTLVARTAVDPAAEGMPEVTPAEAEARKVAHAADAILRAAGTEVGAALRLKAYFSDLADLRTAYQGWNSAIPDGVPAFTAVGVPKRLVLPHARSQFDLIAACPQ